MKKKKKIIIVCICIALAVIIFGGAVLSGKLLYRMPASYIENRMSREIPIGSSAQEVIDKVQKYDILESILTIYPTGSIYNSDGKVVRHYYGELKSGDYYVGTQHIEVLIGSGWCFHTTVYFALDDNDKLIDIAVYKSFYF